MYSAPPRIPENASKFAVAGLSGSFVNPGAVELFQFRNSHASVVAIIERIVLQMAISAAVTAAQEMALYLSRVTGWSAQGTGGTALSLTTAKRRTSGAASSMAAGDIRMCTTAGLGAGTKTIATDSLWSGSGPSTNAVGSAGPVHVIEADEGEDLMILENNEGFIIGNLIALATGNARFHIGVQWREEG